MFFQFSVNGDKLDLQLYQRSADLFLWVPFNIASYSLLLMLIAKLTGYKPWVFTHTLWDCHIYNNHIEQVSEQLSREPFDFPTLEILKEIKTLEDLENLVFEDIKLLDYNSFSSIKAPVAV
jgi:thymidylate synthase